MTAKELSSQNNVWFGVAMFLIGLIAGVVLAFASGNLSGPSAKPSVNAPSAAPSPQAPQAKADVQDRMAVYADEIGLNAADFKTCVMSNKYDSKITDQQAGGSAAGISGTPGNIIYDLKSKKGILVSGAQPVASFQKIIDAMLKDPKAAMAQPGVELAKDVVPVDFDIDHVRGDSSATIALIEYSDYQCPFCLSVHPTYQKLTEQYGSKVVWVYRHFPLAFHPEALPLAVGAECAKELGGNDAFWAFTDKVMSE